ncbi:MAG: asparaginase domain-containing protein [Bacteriovoracaceae bacterium]
MKIGNDAKVKEMVTEIENTKNDKTKVIVLTTGGTIDKVYDEFDGSLQNRQSQIKKMLLSKLRLPYTELEVISILAKDSLNITDYDRSLIVQSIEKQMQKGHPIMVIHGTDTMAKTARFCFENIKDPLVPIVFTGAMRPLGFVDSDAFQNVTEALLVSKILPNDIYISFHNRVFKVPNVKKNQLTKTFECT